MADGRLPKAPLVEAIFEMKWKLDQISPGVKADPNYKLLLGRLYDRLCEKEYPFHEQLPTANMPDEMAPYIIQHRFRKKENGWPLFQLGPGIVTLNETEGYDWPDFKKRLSDLLTQFFASYPNPQRIQIEELTLRYIDAIDFNYSQNILTFLKEKIGMDIIMPDSLFIDTPIKNTPIALDFRITYPFPNGGATIRFARGTRHNKDALISETVVNSQGKGVPQKQEDINQWIIKSHDLTHIWFNRLYEKLLEQFK